MSDLLIPLFLAWALNKGGGLCPTWPNAASPPPPPGPPRPPRPAKAPGQGASPAADLPSFLDYEPPAASQSAAAPPSDQGELGPPSHPEKGSKPPPDSSSWAQPGPSISLKEGMKGFKPKPKPKGGYKYPGIPVMPGAKVTPRAQASSTQMNVSVSDLQNVLIKRGVKLKRDGVYGPKTANAWSALAKSKRLPGSIARVNPKIARVATNTYTNLSVPAIP